ncbi:MAG: ZIP family metal transporter [Solirubrobacteraceae bacterium]
MPATALSFAHTALLGAIAGATIFLGLPVGRMHALGTRARLALAMLSVGILAFIFMDVASHGEAIVQERLLMFKHHHSSFWHVAWLYVLLSAGFVAGSVGITAVERRLRSRPTLVPPLAGGSAHATALERGDEATGAAEQDARLAARRRALRTGMTVASAIGLHNFAEGLAIGVSAATGAIGLATVLVVGFAAHNATEGFGIVGPLGEVRPSWRWLVGAGAVGGGPTFLGTMIGYQVTSAPLELLFYALAAGALIYVIGEIWSAMRRVGHKELALTMLAVGFLAGVLTDLIVSYGGA